MLFCNLAACKKHDENTIACKPDMAGYSGTYVVTTASYKAKQTDAEQDYFNQLYFEPCMRDDFWNFNVSGICTFTDAGIKCSPARDGSGIWSVTGSQHIVDGKGTTVEGFDCSRMILLFKNFKLTGDELRLTFIKQ